MKLSSQHWLLKRLGRALVSFVAVIACCVPAARAQNIDEGKSAQQLYAATCAACHRNASALAKGRFRATLFPFLQDHYTTGSSEAWALASYLAEVDRPPAAKKNKQAKAGARGARPPAAVPAVQRN